MNDTDYMGMLKELNRDHLRRISLTSPKSFIIRATMMLLETTKTRCLKAAENGETRVSINWNFAITDAQALEVIDNWAQFCINQGLLITREYKKETQVAFLTVEWS